MGQDKERKLVVWFTNDERGLPDRETTAPAERFATIARRWEGDLHLPHRHGIQGKLVGDPRSVAPPKTGDSGQRPSEAAARVYRKRRSMGADGGPAPTLAKR